ncbi:head-tail connector protein [Bacillus cytotoxicus]|uniref:head-tail connector protein n=1 Tax=Bacillus cytotoxicus TaxID=580165 RepID=UPI0035CC497D
MLVTVEEAKEWIRVDEDDTRTITMLIKAAEKYIFKATGRTFDEKNEDAKLLCLFLVADWYENRLLVGDRASKKVRTIVQSMILQLQYAPEPQEEGL